jgi:hypothetical protein
MPRRRISRGDKETGRNAGWESPFSSVLRQFLRFPIIGKTLNLPFSGRFTKPADFLAILKF